MTHHPATNPRSKVTSFVILVHWFLLLNKAVVHAYLNNNNPSDLKGHELQKLPILDPKVTQSLQEATKLVLSQDDLTKIDSTNSLKIHNDDDNNNNNNVIDDSKTDVVSSSTTTNVKRQRWGVDNGHDNEYWNDRRIHTFGNVGFMGAFHAALAPISTKLIDIFAYDGKDVRHIVADELSKVVKTNKARICDLCCGVGTSTRALRDAFPEAETVIGVDTSNEMISMAQFLSDHFNVVKPFAKQHLKFLIPLAECWFEGVDNNKINQEEGTTRIAGFTTEELISSAAIAPTTKSINILKSISTSIPKDQNVIPTTFACGNAEETPFPGQSFNLVTIMYAFHEAPKEGRDRILREAHRLLEPGGTLAVVDIHSNFKPSKSMLSGEPYVKEYQKNIHQQLRHFEGFSHAFYKSVVPENVGFWVLKRDT